MPPEKINTSFIPKGNQKTPRKKRSKPMGILVILGIVAIIISLLGWGWAYLRVEALESSRDELAKNLEEQKQAFEPGFLRELEELDLKLKAANNLLDEHVVLTPFFRLLEELTVVEVRYTTFDLSEKEENYQVRLEGEATGYEAIALQSDSFGSSRAFINPVVSNLDLRNDGTVEFAIDFVLSDEIISYRNFVSENPQADRNFENDNPEDDIEEDNDIENGTENEEEAGVNEDFNNEIEEQ